MKIEELCHTAFVCDNEIINVEGHWQLQLQGGGSTFHALNYFPKFTGIRTTKRELFLIIIYFGLADRPECTYSVYMHG